MNTVADPSAANMTKETYTKDMGLEAGASAHQSVGPVDSSSAHRDASHVHTPYLRGYVEANHQCDHGTKDIQECLIYDGPDADAALISVEHMITPRLYETLDAEERTLWHSHIFEAKSGMLMVPPPTAMPTAAGEVTETKEMENVIELYAKSYQLDRPTGGVDAPSLADIMDKL